MIYPEILQKLINCYKKLPGIGERTAERLALATLEFDEEIISDFSYILSNSKKLLKPCNICGHLTDEDNCCICIDDKRNKNLICILEDYKSVFAFEKSGNYSGVYHVLGGLISPIKNIGPDSLNIESLKDRVKNLDNPELIVALKSSIEGETTTLYLKKIFEEDDVVISRLSYGIPIGAEFDYIDVMTLDKAIFDRKKISE